MSLAADPLQTRATGEARATEMQVLTFLSSFCFSLSTAFYFHVGEQEEKCIIEDIPSDTLITGEWNVLSSVKCRPTRCGLMPATGVHVAGR